MAEIVTADAVQITQLKGVEEDIRTKRSSISFEDTPASQVKQRPDGMDYVEEGFMRNQLNRHYPIWSWELDEVQFLGGEWVWCRGHLSIVEEGITRKFGSVGATRVQFRKGKDHIPANIVDIDKNVASANTDAFKRAVNRLCNVCDDIYRKQILEPLSENDKDRLASTLDKADDKLRRAINVKIDRGEIHSRNLDDWIKLIEDKLKESK